ncbi:CoA transferase [bacterium]|nr:CoA transferase [bacterium]
MSGPLNGIRVLDLTRVLAGPYATMILRDLGAEVIKIEQPGVGDEARGVGPFKNGVSLYFMSINRGKKSITLNLRTERGKNIFWDLVKQSDIVIENFRPGTMKRLGLDYESIKLQNPKIIYAACSGFGQTGPYSTRGAYDMIIQAMGGIVSITGEPGRPPVRVGASIGDMTAAMYTVIGILSALHHRERTGEGQLVDVAMLDCQVAILENAIARYLSTGQVPQPLGSRHPSFTPFETFETQDGYVVLAIGNNNLWAKFCSEIECPRLIDDERFKTNALRTEHYDELRPILANIMKKRTTDQWVEEMEKIGIPCGPINTIDKVVQQPQIQAREMIVEVEHQIAGKVKMAGVPIKLSDTPGKIEHPAPDLGEHTSEVLSGLLGLSGEYITQLREDDVI